MPPELNQNKHPTPYVRYNKEKYITNTEIMHKSFLRHGSYQTFGKSLLSCISTLFILRSNVKQTITEFNKVQGRGGLSSCHPPINQSHILYPEKDKLEYSVKGIREWQLYLACFIFLTNEIIIMKNTNSIRSLVLT